MRSLAVVFACCVLLAGCAHPLAVVPPLDPAPVTLRLPNPSEQRPGPEVLGGTDAAATAAIRRAAHLRDCYQRAYAEMAATLNSTQRPNLKRAVFLTENAYFGDSLDYRAFDEHIRSLA